MGSSHKITRYGTFYYSMEKTYFESNKKGTGSELISSEAFILVIGWYLC